MSDYVGAFPSAADEIAYWRAAFDRAEAHAADLTRQSIDLRLALQQHAATGLCGARFRDPPAGSYLTCSRKPHGAGEQHQDVSGLCWSDK